MAEQTVRDFRLVWQRQRPTDPWGPAKKNSKLKTLKEKSHLRLDVDFGFGIFGQPGHVDLTVKVSNVADNGVILHVFKVAEGQDRKK